MSRKLSRGGATSARPILSPKNERQAEFLRAMRSNSMVIARGSAGTGKTYCAAMTAARAYLDAEVDSIVVTRPNIPTGPTLGSYPGDSNDKMVNWVRPILNVLSEGFGKGSFAHLMERERIVLQPMESIRGASFERAFVICDEAQQLSVEEIKALSTRLGRDSHMVFIGDPSQRDVRVSGLEWLSRLCLTHGIECPVIEFTPDHIVRSDLVAQLVRAFEKDLQRDKRILNE